MPKQGIISDYDLFANKEKSAQDITCTICGTSPVSFQWSDFSGEAMCTTCGCPYQLKWGGETMEQEGDYPYLRLKDEFIAPCRLFWEEKKLWVYYGISLGHQKNLDVFSAWYEAYLEKQKDES